MDNATFGALMHSFVDNDQVRLVAVLWAADLVLGIVAALNRRMFKLSYIGDTLRTDATKVFMWFVLFSFGKVAGNSDIVGPVDFGTYADAAFVLVTGMFAGSILKSIRDFGLDLPESLAGSDPASLGDGDTLVVPSDS